MKKNFKFELNSKVTHVTDTFNLLNSIVIERIFIESIEFSGVVEKYVISNAQGHRQVSVNEIKIQL